MGLFNWLKEKRGKLLIIWDAGNGSVLGRGMTMINFFLLVTANVGVYGFGWGIPEYALIGIAAICIVLFSGFLYIRTGFMREEIKARQAHNPYIMETLRNTRKILEEVKQSKNKN